MLKRLAVLLILGLALLGATITNAQTQVPPPPVTAALAAFNLYLTEPITFDRLDSYQFTQGTHADSALGCPLVVGVPLAAPVTAYRVQLVFQSVLYEIEVSADTTMIVPCSPQLIAPASPIIVATVVGPTLGLTGCPVDFAGYLPPRLTVGGFARIGADGQPNRMRAAPSLDGEQIGLIAPGTTVEVLDGPICEAASRIVWWQVQDGSLVGYTAESQENDYFLEPVEAGALPIVPGVRDLITAFNASSLVTLSAVPFEGGATLDFGGAGQLLVAGTTGITWYDLDQRIVGNLTFPPDTVVVEANFSPDGHTIAYSTGLNQLFVYDTVTEQTTQLEVNEGTVINDLDFSPDNLLAVALGDPLGGQQNIVNGWSIYDLTDQTRVLEFTSASWAGDVAFDPGGVRLAWLSDTLNVERLYSEDPAINWPLEQPTRTGLAWQPVPDINDPAAIFRVAYADGNNVHLVDIATSQLVTFANEEEYLPGTLAFSAEGSVLAVMNRAVMDEPTPRTLKLLDVVTGDLLFSQELETARAMAFSPDGTLIAVLTDETLRIYGIAAMGEAVG